MASQSEEPGAFQKLVMNRALPIVWSMLTLLTRYKIIYHRNMKHVPDFWPTFSNADPRLRKRASGEIAEVPISIPFSWQIWKPGLLNNDERIGWQNWL